MSLVETRQHGQVAQTLKRWMKPRSNTGLLKMDPAKCDASLPVKRESISAASTTLPSPASSFGEGSSLHGETTHHVVQDLDAWINEATNQPNSSVSGEFHDEDQEKKALPRTSSECSEFWSRMQATWSVEETGPRSRAASADHSTDYDFRPRTPTVVNEGVACGSTIPDESELLKRNSELEDRVAELERKLLELAAQNSAA